jgi:Bifunctional DNA primase/polymerase, N-terminal
VGGDPVTALHIPVIDPDDDVLSAAFKYAEAGWYVLPVMMSTKHPGSVVGNHWQDQSSRDPKMLAAWYAGTSGLGIALHQGRSGAVAVDVDKPEVMPDVLAAACIRTVHQSTRDNHADRGHYLFAMPPGRNIGNSNGALGKDWGEIRGKNGVVIVEPSHHEKAADGGRYRWVTTGELLELPADVAALLPDAADATDAATDAQVTAFLAEHTTSTRPELVNVWCRNFDKDVTAGGSRHQSMNSKLVGAMKEARAGFIDARAAADTLESMFLTAVGKAPNGKQGAPRSGAIARNEWAGLLSWAVAQARAADLDEVRARVDAKVPARSPLATESEPPATVDFWDEREVLAHIRDFARGRMTSPWAVLGVALARVLTTVPPYVVLPPTIGTQASLNLFVALVGASGMGKGAAEGAAADSLDVGEDVFTATVGSGEGVAHLYSHWTAKTGVVRDRSAVLFTIPEVDILTALGSRVGSTILSVLRSAFSGEKLGFSNASKERTLPLDRHTYRLCLVLGVQPERAATLMNDADGGTPQRFLWLPTADPDIPDITPDTPRTMKLPAQQWKRGNFPLHHLTVPDVATDTIRQAHRSRLRGEGDALDGHALLCRLKTAVALTFLDGRQVVTPDDWRLSETVMAVSDTTRARVIARLAEQANARTEAQGRADGVRADAASQSSDERAARRISARLLGKVVAAGECSRSDARNAIARRDRIHFDAALERLIAAGQVEVLDTEHGSRIKATGVPS